MRRGHAFALIAGLIALSCPVIPAAIPVVSAATVPAGSSAYTPIAPLRAADTRPESGSFGFTRVSAGLIRIQITGRADLKLPANATAVVLNIAGTNAAGAGFVTAFPSGGNIPTASSLNIDKPGRTIANLATVRLSAGGSVDLFANIAMDLIVDVAGVYAPVSDAVSSGRLSTIPGGARRALDTRERGVPMGRDSTEVVDLTKIAGVTIPADATAVVVNLAAIDAMPGFWTAFPSADPVRPLASSLNIDEVGQIRNSQGIVALSPGSRSFKIYSQGGGHLVVDVVGWYTGAASPKSTDGLFVPNSPLRMLDTRNTFAVTPWGQTTVEFASGSSLPIDQVAAAAMNIAISDPLNVGFITAYPAGQSRPLAANLNVTAFDQIIANHAIVRVGTRGIALYTQGGTQMIADITGWFLGTPDVSSQPALPIPSFGPTYATKVMAPSGGIDNPVGYGPSITKINDAGLSGLWAGYGNLGVPDHNIYFAHRTSHGGPYLNIDRMSVGDQFQLLGADGHQYIYQVLRVDVILPVPSTLINIAVNAAKTTATIVACTPPHSTKHRIAVTGRLIGAA